MTARWRRTTVSLRDPRASCVPNHRSIGRRIVGLNQCVRFLMGEHIESASFGNVHLTFTVERDRRGDYAAPIDGEREMDAPEPTTP